VTEVVRQRRLDVPIDSDLGAVHSILKSDLEESLLLGLAGLKRDLLVLKDRWRTATELALRGGEVETGASAAHAAFEEWGVADGKRVALVLDGLRAVFPELAPAEEVGVLRAVEAATLRAQAEHRRCASLVEHDDAIGVRVVELEERIAKAGARLAILDDMASVGAEGAAHFARVLAEILPHATTEVCPVCSRDFSEVSDAPLSAHIALRLQELTRTANELEANAKERTRVMAEYHAVVRLRDELVGQRLDQQTRVQTKSRAADMAKAQRELAALRPAAKTGADLQRVAAETRRRLAEVRAQGGVARDTKVALDDIARRIGEAALGDAEPIDAAIDRLEGRLQRDGDALAETQAVRRRTLDALMQARELDAEFQKRSAELAQQEQQRTRSREAFNAAQARLGDAKRLAENARAVRASVIGRVFNDKLNRLWRDLFVRLAPAEPFVPAFKVPDPSKGPMVARFETVHRDGGRAGTPGAMLSAGNLNTAALTLFLALHLSVEPRLRCLVLDDPVQSMDEVHIAQLAAVLRTVARQHERQVIIAVHERPLFDYLSLELSPAFPDDRLITVELQRKSTGELDAEPTFHDWERDATGFAA
jgi:exonuclease SbcC